MLNSRVSGLNQVGIALLLEHIKVSKVLELLRELSWVRSMVVLEDDYEIYRIKSATQIPRYSRGFSVEFHKALGALIMNHTPGERHCVG